MCCVLLCKPSIPQLSSGEARARRRRHSLESVLGESSSGNAPVRPACPFLRAGLLLYETLPLTPHITRNTGRFLDVDREKQPRVGIPDRLRAGAFKRPDCPLSHAASAHYGSLVAPLLGFAACGTPSHTAPPAPSGHPAIRRWPSRSQLRTSLCSLCFLPDPSAWHARCHRLDAITPAVRP